MRKNFTLLLLTALFALVACDYNESQKNEQETYIDNLMSQCKNFNSETLVQGLPGKWERDSYLIYEDEWQNKFSVYMLQGVQHGAGLASSELTFYADNNGFMYIINTSLNPNANSHILNFDWYFDTYSHKLHLSGENYNTEYKVSGFNNEYLVLDHYDSVNKQNTREIYKRIVE